MRSSLSHNKSSESANPALGKGMPPPLKKRQPFQGMRHVRYHRFLEPDGGGRELATIMTHGSIKGTVHY